MSNCPGETIHSFVKVFEKGEFWFKSSMEYWQQVLFYTQLHEKSRRRAEYTVRNAETTTFPLRTNTSPTRDFIHGCNRKFIILLLPYHQHRAKLQLSPIGLFFFFICNLSVIFKYSFVHSAVFSEVIYIFKLCLKQNHPTVSCKLFAIKGNSHYINDRLVCV